MFPEQVKLMLLWNRMHCLQCIDFYKENIRLQICCQEPILRDESSQFFFSCFHQAAMPSQTSQDHTDLLEIPVYLR